MHVQGLTDECSQMSLATPDSACYLWHAPLHLPPSRCLSPLLFQGRRTALEEVELQLNLVKQKAEDATSQAQEGLREAKASNLLAQVFPPPPSPLSPPSCTSCFSSSKRKKTWASGMCKIVHAFVIVILLYVICLRRYLHLYVAYVQRYIQRSPHMHAYMSSDMHLHACKPTSLHVHAHACMHVQA